MVILPHEVLCIHAACIVIKFVLLTLEALARQALFEEGRSSVNVSILLLPFSSQKSMRNCLLGVFSEITYFLRFYTMLNVRAVITTSSKLLVHL